MRKIIFIIIICLFFLPHCASMYSCREVVEEETEELDEELEEEEEEEAEEEEEKEVKERRKIRLKDRGFEFGFNARVGFSNDFVSVNDIFKEIVEIDLDNLPDNLRMNFGVGMTPFYFMKSKEKRGYGLSVNIDATGVLDLSGDFISLSEAADKKSEFTAAVFADTGFDIFFHIHKFKITLRPAAYVPIMYIKSDILYTFDATDGAYIDIEAKSRVYTAIPMEDFPSDFVPTFFPGIDFSFGVEYPLSNVLGLNKISRVLDFDVGVDFINIPLLPARMKSYMDIVNKIKIDSNHLDDLFDSFDDMDDFFTDPVYGNKSITLNRPFRMASWVNWRPFGNELLSLIPSLGFSINPIYQEPFCMEGGLKLRIDLFNILMVTAGMNYEDRLWVNGILLAVNLRLVELNIGADVRSQEFLSNWNVSGVGLYAGLKFGW